MCEGVPRSMAAIKRRLCLVVAALVQAWTLEGKLVFRPLMHQPRIYQGAPADMHVTTVHAYDPDKPRNKVEYSLPDILDRAIFEVDSVSGNLTTAKAIRKAVGKTYQVMVAAESYGVSELEHLQIVVTEFNQFAPRFEREAYKAEMHLSVPVNSTVLQVKAFDPDPVPLNAEVYYRMDQNPASTFFQLDSLTGILTTIQLMNNTESVLRFGIFAEDGGSPKRWSHVQVEITLRTISAPEFINISNVTLSSALVCWRLPEFGEVSGYIMTYGIAGLEKTSSFNTTSHDLDTCKQLSGLEDDTEYEVQITAWNPENIGISSEAQSFKTKTNPCLEELCKSGSCNTTHSWPFYKCSCMLGYYGNQCQFFNPCSTSPCGNNGSCVNTTHNDFVCVCAEDYTGPKCGYYNPCLKKPHLCKNGGVCQVTTNSSYVCTCSPGFLARNCELQDLCYSNPCQNGGSCSHNAAEPSVICSCPPGLSGEFCELDVDECTSNPCRNGSTCINHKGSFTCICQLGFSGKTCSTAELCPPDRTDDDYGNFYWIASYPDDELSLNCPYGSLIDNGKAMRKCLLGNKTATWDRVDTSQCKSKDNLVADEIVDELDSLTVNATTLDSEKLATAAEGIAKLSTFAATDPKLAQGMINVISNVMNANLSLIEAEEHNNISDSLLQIVDEFASQVPLQMGEVVHVDSENVRVSTVGWNTTKSKETVDLNAPSRSKRLPPQTMMQVIVPNEALQKAHQQVDKDVRLKFVVYYNDKLFRPKVAEPEKEKISQPIPTEPTEKFPVIDISIDNVTVTNLSTPLIYIFPMVTNLRARCVYWSEINRIWNTDGLTTNHTDRNVICKSTHLTAFSVLLDPTPSDEITEAHEEALSFISYVGCGLSVIGLFLTLLTYSLFRCLNRDRQGKILLNLCTSLLMLNMSFLLGVLKPQFGSNTCAVVALMVHYFLLTSLSWMCVEAINMYQLLIHVFATSETHFLLKRHLGAWGGPFIIVGMTAAFDLQEYFNDNDYCILSPHNPWIYYMAFMAPSCIILLINLGIFILVSRVLFTPRLKTQVIFRCKPNDATVTAAQVRGAFTVMILLGVTWIFGTFAVGSVKLVFQYMFCITNSLQGFLIFLVRCLLYPEARGAWFYFFKSGRLKKQRGTFPPVSFSTNSQVVKNATLSTGMRSEDKGDSDVCFNKATCMEEVQTEKNAKDWSQNKLNTSKSTPSTDLNEEHIDADTCPYEIRNIPSIRESIKPERTERSASVGIVNQLKQNSYEQKKRSFSLDTCDNRVEGNETMDSRAQVKDRFNFGFNRQHPILEKEDSGQSLSFSDTTSTSTDVDDTRTQSICDDAHDLC